MDIEYLDCYLAPVRRKSSIQEYSLYLDLFESVDDDITEKVRGRISASGAPGAGVPDACRIRELEATVR